jgi:hypothetical protein
VAISIKTRMTSLRRDGSSLWICKSYTCVAPSANRRRLGPIPIR